MISDITARKQAGQELRDRSEQLRKPASELTLAERRERRRIARILHDHIEELLDGVKRRTAPLERVEQKTVSQALKDIQDFIDQTIGLPRDKSSAEKGKPMRLKKAVDKKAQKSGSRKSSDKPRRKRR